MVNRAAPRGSRIEREETPAFRDRSLYPMRRSRDWDWRGMAGIRSVSLPGFACIEDCNCDALVRNESLRHSGDTPAFHLERRRSQDWPWSSLRAHLAGRDDGLVCGRREVQTPQSGVDFRLSHRALPRLSPVMVRLGGAKKQVGAAPGAAHCRLNEENV